MDYNLQIMRRELDRLYNRLEKLEREQADPKQIQTYRARTRQLADEISNMELGKDA
jgi:hypothetical protein